MPGDYLARGVIYGSGVYSNFPYNGFNTQKVYDNIIGKDVGIGLPLPCMAPCCNHPAIDEPLESDGIRKFNFDEG